VAVRLRVRIERAAAGKTPAVDTVAVANSGFEAGAAEVLLPVRVAEWLALWPPPRGARVELVAVGRGLYRVGPRGRLRRSDAPERW